MEVEVPSENMDLVSKPELPLVKQIAYSMGMLGWMLMTSIYLVMLLYMYEPPEGKGLEPLIPHIPLAFGLTVLTLVMASGRLFDAITDPLIAQLTDKNTNKKGRRIPIMRWAVIPTILFCGAMYRPWNYEASNANIVWLVFTQLGFFVFMTLYNVPYNALLPELGHNSRLKLRLATLQGAMMLIGMVMGASFLVVSEQIIQNFDIEEKIRSYQYAIYGFSIFAGICMAIPAWAIDEKKYCVAKPASLSMSKAIRQTFKNRHFKFFLVADFSYFTAMAIIFAGLLYYVTVLLNQSDSFGSKMMGIMVGGAMLMVFTLSRLTRKFGKKRLIIFSFFSLGSLCLAIFFLGKYPLRADYQGYLISLLTCIPLGIMSILPSALLAEISALDGKQSGQQNEGMFFAVRNLGQKFGQTLGLVIITVLFQFGKDPGDDLGIRLTGIVGLVLCVIAGITFIGFNEGKMKREMAEFEPISEE
ncbi:MAG: GPH family glycoside/pentoside/hexuronide:cation symporter [Limisphaerales bacterium]|jgi:GPH family glycoside/pentoside/hexuronide:cation symporter